MVVFNELRIADDKQSLVIDCQIEGLEIYSAMYIKTVYLEYYKNAETVGVPSSKALLVYDKGSEEEGKTAVRFCIDKEQLPSDMGVTDFDKGLFFVTVTCDGDLPADAALMGCGTDNTVDTAIVLDWHRVYERGMQYISMLNDKCFDDCNDIPGFKNFILMWYALRLAISTCDYGQIGAAWERFLKIYSHNPMTLGANGCGCGK